jgi:hypothetical protein
LLLEDSDIEELYKAVGGGCTRGRKVPAETATAAGSRSPSAAKSAQTDTVADSSSTTSVKTFESWATRGPQGSSLRRRRSITIGDVPQGVKRRCLDDLQGDRRRLAAKRGPADDLEIDRQRIRKTTGGRNPSNSRDDTEKFEQNCTDVIMQIVAAPASGAGVLSLFPAPVRKVVTCTRQATDERGRNCTDVNTHGVDAPASGSNDCAEVLFAASDAPT